MTSLASELAAIELAFDPHELRIPKGQPRAGEWVHTPSAKPGTGIHRYVVPDAERLVIPPPKTPGRKNYYVRPEDHPFFQAHPVSPENVLKAYDAADEGVRAQGRDWYLQNHDVAKIIGGGDAEKGAILLSAYSPQKPWPYNMFQAMKSSRRGRALGPGEGMAITGDNQKMAQAGIDGAGVDEVMKGPKTHSFGVLLKQGDDSPDDPYGHVVIDTHALNVAVGGGLRGKAGDKAPIDSARYHQYVADQYREAARRISEREGKLMKPHQLQAITWMVQQQANQAEDEYEAEHGLLSPKERGRVKGRASMTRNAWKVWTAYAKKHNVQLVPGISSLAGQIALAQLIELAEGVSTVMDMGFDPHEPRDPATGEWVTFYHGTSDEAARKIEKQGLRPSTGAPTDLTITTDPEDAAYVAASRVRGWPRLKPAVVKITIPAGLVDQYVSPHGNMPSAALASMVPPHYLSVEYDRIPEHVRRNVGLPPREAGLATELSCPDCGCSV